MNRRGRWWAGSASSQRHWPNPLSSFWSTHSCTVTISSSVHAVDNYSQTLLYQGLPCPGFGASQGRSPKDAKKLSKLFGSCPQKRVGCFHSRYLLSCTQSLLSDTIETVEAALSLDSLIVTALHFRMSLPPSMKTTLSHTPLIEIGLIMGSTCDAEGSRCG